jgi:hypothetical protein
LSIARTEKAAQSSSGEKQTAIAAFEMMEAAVGQSQRKPIERSGRSDCHPLHVAAAAAITTPVVHISVAIRRIGSVRRLSLAPWPLDAADEGQDEEHRDEPSTQAHCNSIGSIRLGSLFFTFPTRALTGQQSTFGTRERPLGCCAG